MAVGIGLILIIGTASSAEVPVVEKSKPVAKIYVHPDELKPVERMKYYKMNKMPSELSIALRDLNYHLEKMSGAKLDIVEESDPQKIPSPAIVVGKLAEQLGAVCAPSEWKEGYRILTRDGRVLISGERLVASSYGVYGFLQMMGCDWVMPGPLGEVIPKRDTVGIPETDLAVKPDFGLRWMWIGGGPKYLAKEPRAEYDQWLIRQRMGVCEEYSERINEAHMWNKLVDKYKAEFQKDPEMLALVRMADGSYKRQGPQIETSNPKTVDLVARYIREQFVENNWPKDKKITLSVGPADGLDFSESPESRGLAPEKFNPVSGTRDATDLVVDLANKVIEKIGNEYPNLTLGFYVYSAHDDFPQKVIPNPRIRPILAPITYSRLHSTNDPHSKTRTYYRNVADKWAEWAKPNGVPLMVYEYNWNLAENMLPFTRIKTIAEDLKFYKERNFHSITVESINAWATLAPHNYIFARMTWDTSLDWRKLLSEFCRKAYGAGAEDIEKYYLRLVDVQGKAGLEAGSYYSAALIFNDAYVKAARTDIDTALKNPDLSTEQRKRIEAVSLGFHSLELYLAWNRASNEFDFAKAMKIGEEMRAYYKTTLEANPLFIARQPKVYIDRFLLKATEDSLKFSTPPYKIVYKLPDQLQTTFDPTGQGEYLNLYGTEINDSGWVRTKTWSSTWDAQGLGLLRTGSVWYRINFDVPADLRGQGIGLLLGAFDDEAKVWGNGKYAGTSGIKFAQPAAIDLTDAIVYGGNNQLTIEIRRNSLANELLTGGIFRPSFVFCGPRIVQSERPAEAVRVLPGGEQEKVAPIK
ncbi:MAG: hypothetical protein A2X45_07405 [Lentisphaerae bacterium GWF2_50_93]|nr:MAG: hypothetical protein A2X45_07405 [Lentisphaerae bacterium GWF2_50_93]